MGEFNLCLYPKGEFENLQEEIRWITKTKNNNNVHECEKRILEAETSFSNYRQISTEAINNLKEQIHYSNNV